MRIRLAALEKRQDVMVVDKRLWGFEPYVSFIFRRLGGIGSPSPTLDALEANCEIAASGEVSCW